MQNTLKIPHKKTLRVNEFNKVLRYKINTHTNQLHFYTATVNNPKWRQKSKPDQQDNRPKH